MSSNKVILHFPVEFNALYMDKGYWPYAVVELPNGDHFPVYLPMMYKRWCTKSRSVSCVWPVVIF
jgi:hypothetical protein